MLSKETLLSQEQQQQPEIAVADFSIPLYLSNRSVVFNFICTIALPYSNFVWESPPAYKFALSENIALLWK